MDARYHRIPANACEMRRRWRIDHHQNADILQIDRLSFPVESCYKWSHERIRKQLIGISVCIRKK
ncbi:unnamed protein product [Hymenolepis diminuta]|uniref:Uncharacterized protein n=1 Tax=Hymenolepis diminuta TaxID=6216 RepID=A0A564Y9X5_HYMDI|nr:unnamed protein product [Hymenolepis diminuta]